MKKRNVSWVALSLSILLSSSWAHALAEISVVGGVHQIRIQSTGTGGNASGSASLGPVAGASFHFTLIPLLLGFDAGVVHLWAERTTTQGGSWIETQARWKELQIPLILRLTALPVISPGVGLYYGLGMGNIDHTTKVAGVFQSSGSSSYQQAGLRGGHVGWVGSLRARFPLVPLVDFVVDGRYVSSLSDQARDASDTYKTSSVQILAGVKVGL